MRLNFVYRISDNSYQKDKLPGATKAMCLENFRKVFGGYDPLVLADNCKFETIEWLWGEKLTVIPKTLGNAGSALEAINIAITNYDGPVYFVEDDYLHQMPACWMIEEGLGFGDYVTLYDHPDKYTNVYGGGEDCRVFKGEWHWRTTVSTCMTFAADVKTLKKDRDVFEKYCKDGHPHDHAIFSELRERGRRLVCAIPGVACHTDLTFSGHIGRNTLEPWAIEYVIDLMFKDLKELNADVYRQTKRAADNLDDRLMSAALVHAALEMVQTKKASG